MKSILGMLILALFAHGAYADDSDDSGDAPGNPDAGANEKAYTEGVACDDLAQGMIFRDTGPYKARADLISKMRTDLATADSVRDSQYNNMISSRLADFLKACQYTSTHRQDTKGNQNLATQGTELSNALKKYKAAIETAWQDTVQLKPMLDEELRQRQAYLDDMKKRASAPGLAMVPNLSAVEKPVKALQTCRDKQIKVIRRILKDNAAFDESVAAKMKSCADYQGK
jgi:hypothetical protein